MILRDNANIKVDIRALDDSYINGTNAKLGIGTDSPDNTLHVAGNAKITSHLTASGNISASGYIYAGGNVQAGAAGNFGFDGSMQLARINSSDQLYVGVSNNWSSIQIGKNSTQSTLFTGNITASGQISASGLITAPSASFNVLKGDTSVATGLVVSGYIEATPQLQYSTSSISATGNVQGDIIKFGNTTTIAGAIYAHTGSGWTMAHSGSNGHTSHSLALAVGTNSTTDGMLLRGMANIGYSPGGLNGCALYLEAPGSASNNVTGTTGHIARVVGWNYGSDTIYFNPDNTWVKVS